MTLAIIDGDVLAYNCCRPRWEKKAKITEEDGVKTTHILLDNNGKRLALEFTKQEDKVYLMESWENFKSDLDKLLGTVFCTDYVMAVKGLNNYRDVIYNNYKRHRKENDYKGVADFVPSIRQLAVMEEYAIFAHGREADDYIRIWAEEAKRNGQDYVICSIDKDLRCIPGKHYLIHHKKMIEVSELEAKAFYYQQLLTGDATDNIPGIPGIGPVKAQKHLAGCITDEDFQEAVVSLYIDFYQDEWKEYLLSNGKMIHIQKHPEDYFSLSDWPIVRELE